MGLASVLMGLASSVLTLVAAYFMYMWIAPSSSSYETAFYGSVSLLLFAAAIGMVAIILGAVSIIKNKDRWVGVVGVVFGSAPLLMMTYQRLAT